MDAAGLSLSCFWRVVAAKAQGDGGVNGVAAAQAVLRSDIGRLLSEGRVERDQRQVGQAAQRASEGARQVGLTPHPANGSRDLGQRQGRRQERRRLRLQLRQEAVALGVPRFRRNKSVQKDAASIVYVLAIV